MQSFNAYDADFFLDLLPGPRDRLGFPDSIRFWRMRIGESNNIDNQGVGLIYGPSGCGKSSFVKAGLIPALNDHVLPIYVEATSEGTESRIEAAVRQAVAGVPEHLSLAAILDSIRDGRWMPYGQKMLIVIDQFEQWLQNRDPAQLTELVRAIRQCDGRRVECLLMVRDDFWLATSRFMRAIEIELLEGRNATLIDLFDLQHANKVLCKFGQAYNALPHRLADLTKTQKRFLEQVVDGIAVQGKVVCVHLALFAAMFKDKPWTTTQLAKVGGPQGVGVKFLEDSFASRAAKPEHLLHEEAARKFLEALLPDSGSDIRGNMLPATKLQQVSGYANQDQAFLDLTRILDQELRLVTLTDPLGLGEKSTSAGSAHYQLTHDFLVAPLRSWLSQRKQSTMRGRAELRLAQRCSTWSNEPTKEYLPGFLEFTNILTLTNRHRWSDQEQKMIRQAAWRHGRSLL
ncbi:MAG: AAA family ATPase, partial [Rubripirellula sp.]